MTTLSDHDQRQQALDPSRSFIVQAPAGSGKTELLTRRFLKLLAHVEAPEEIIAITFTRKAAAEMRSRILDALPIEDKWQLRENPQRLRIQTIDALCASLTRQMPVLSRCGVQPEITLNPYLLYNLAAQEMLAELESDTPWASKLAHLLLHLDNDHTKVEKLFSDMLARRDQWLPYIVDNIAITEKRKLLEQGLQRAIHETLLKIKDIVPDSLLKNLPALNDLTSWQEIAESLLTQQGTWRKKINKLDETLIKLTKHEEMREHLQEIQLLPPNHYNEKQWHILSILIELLPLLVAHLQVLFQEHNAVDYIEVTSSALKALGDSEMPTDLALTLDYRMQHILVDEFQDTSVIQLRLFEHLTAGWQPNDGRTLFLVGDPLQSIYRFRKAEVGLFLQARAQGIGAIQLESLTLQVNFRSTQNIVNWVNNTFSSLLPQQANIAAGAIPFSSSIAQHPALETSTVTLHPQADTNTLVELIKNIPPTHTTAILVRARTHLLEIIPALQAANIPYRAVEIETLQQRPVIRDLLALTRALLHLGDRVAWLAILRAPWCGLSLTDLHALTRCCPNSCIWEGLQIYQGPEHLTRVTAVLALALQQRGRQSLAHWVEGTWHALGGPACLTSSLELNDAAAFFNLLNTVQIGGDIVDISQFEQKLTTLYATTDTSKEFAIDVMTIHKAKGLEFDTVIIPGLERSLPADDSQLLLTLERPTLEHTTDLLLAPIKASIDESDAIYDYLRNEEKKRADHETTRLLYVAATRAKNSLHLFATITADKKPASNSLLAKLWPALADDFMKNLTKQETIISEPIIESSTPLKRLANSWRSPITLSSPTKSNNEQFVHWNNDPARHIGTVVHRLLQRISLEGLTHWNDTVISTRKPYIRNALLQLGVTAEQLDTSAEQVERALKQILNDPRGRWILDDKHQAAAAEYPLTAILNNKPIQIIIDRTFVDAQGIRWIIDYKTGEAEVEQYRQQLERYAQIMRLQDSRPIHLGLYFPLLSVWHEWKYSR